MIFFVVVCNDSTAAHRENTRILSKVKSDPNTTVVGTRDGQGCSLWRDRPVAVGTDGPTVNPLACGEVFIHHHSLPARTVPSPGPYTSVSFHSQSVESNSASQTCVFWRYSPRFAASSGTGTTLEHTRKPRGIVDVSRVRFLFFSLLLLLLLLLSLLSLLSLSYCLKKKYVYTEYFFFQTILPPQIRFPFGYSNYNAISIVVN